MRETIDYIAHKLETRSEAIGEITARETKYLVRDEVKYLVRDEVKYLVRDEMKYLVRDEEITVGET